MIDLPTASWVNLALQIPLALLVALLSIYNMRHVRQIIDTFTKQSEQREEANQQFINQQQGRNEEFIKYIQQSHTESISRLAEEIKSMKNEQIKELANLTYRVDSVIDKTLFWERFNSSDKSSKP